jgi:hypothetical protein
MCAVVAVVVTLVGMFTNGLFRKMEKEFQVRLHVRCTNGDAGGYVCSNCSKHNRSKYVFTNTFFQKLEHKFQVLAMC